MAEINQEVEKKSEEKPKNNLYATGKRKNSVARVWLVPNGKGEIKINKKPINEYFSRSLLHMLIKKPFKRIKKFIEYCNGKKTDLFKIWFLDNTTEVRNSDNQVVMSSKIIGEKNV